MLQGWVVVAIALVYIGLLFAIAHWGDRAAPAGGTAAARPNIYALSLGVYCTSWTFFGSVGLATHRGLDFLTIYIGPILMFTAGYPLLRRVIQLAKSERITSVADFLAARYGKSRAVAGVVTLIATLAVVPYVALQLKAVSFSVTTLVDHYEMRPVFGATGAPVLADVSLVVALAMAAFACLFGTRHVDATEHQAGLMLAIAMESAIKLIAFIAVGLFVIYGVFDGPGDLMTRAMETPETIRPLTQEIAGESWIVMILLSFCAVLLLPRMFHVLVVENNSASELRRARWLFPAYLVAINLFVMPIAIAGLVRFGGSVDADTFVLRLPLAAGSDLFTILAFLGGLSAATAMVIVASVALSIMICNEIVVPLAIRRRRDARAEPADMGAFLLTVRRAAIVAVFLVSYVYYRTAAGGQALAETGLLAFAAIAQVAPAFFGGLIWRRATARGAIAGMTVGLLVWAYTLLLPVFVTGGLLDPAILDHGPFGLWLLRPQALFAIAFEPFAHGVFWSLALNLSAYVFLSLTRAPEPVERLQAAIFVPAERGPTPASRLWRTALTIDDLKTTVARYLGAEHAERAFAAFAAERGGRLDGQTAADMQALKFAERALASAIGAASSRLVVSLLVERRDPSTKTAVKLLDDASAAILYSRDLLQTALDQVRQGISVFDRDLTLVCWNRQFRHLLALPADLVQVGAPLTAILRHLAESGALGPGAPEGLVQARLSLLARRLAPFQERLADSGTVLEIRSSPMPDGGIVTTWTDISERVAAEEALAQANEMLERRVAERTQELTRVNAELASAKAAADEANLGKTRFLAAAGHDILQPLNAARLYATSLVEQTGTTPFAQLAENVGTSLDAVEEIIGALLDISRLDAGALKPEIGVVRLDDILRQLRVEFEPMARDKGLEFTIVPSRATVRSDRRLLRRLLQNLVSNAIKYTPKGRVLVGCRRRGGAVRVLVFDTGLGIPDERQTEIFQEFRRLDQGARVARGLGLGLSIVERIGRVLDHPIGMASRPGRGSVFWVDIAIAAEQPAPATAAAPAALRASPTDLAGAVVLCIDNEPKILSGMAALLGNWGCRVLTAGSGGEALARLREQAAPPDLVLADYHLDNETGLDAIADLRRDAGADLPAALVTADRSAALREAAREYGIAVLNKPLKPAALRALLAQYRVRAPAAE